MSVNVTNMRTILRKTFLLLCCFVPLCLAAQKGYRIDVKLGMPINSTIYLNRITPLECVCVDSAVVKKGKAVLKGQSVLQPGCYHLCDRPNVSDYFPILIDKTQQFSVTLTEAGYSTTGSPENKMYSEFHAVFAQSFSAEDMKQYVENLTSVNPNSLVSKYVNFEYEGVTFLESFQEETDLTYEKGLEFMSKYQDECYMYNSYWSMLMTSLFEGGLEAQKMELFFKYITPKSDVGQFFLKQLMLAYNKDGDAQADEMLLHLYDAYYQPNQLQLFGDDGERRLQKTIERKRRTQIGAEIPNMEVTTESGSKASTNNIQRKYTVVWFWDPDCEDCQHETPILHQFYVENADTYDFEVFGVSITEDVNYWKEKTNEWGLTWINSCMGLGGYNYDFVDYLSLIATPASFLLDENHKIILRNFTPEQLQEYFENLDK